MGNGLIKENGLITFVPYTVIGEEIDYTIVKRAKNYNIGALNKIKEASSNRTTPLCPYYEMCGSCNFQHIDYKEQLNIKKNIVQNAFSKIAKLDVSVDDVLSSDDTAHYRNKASFPVKNGRIGYYMAKTHEIIDIDFCLLVKKPMLDIIKAIKPYCQNSFLSHIVIRVIDSKTMVTLVTQEKNYKKLFANQLSQLQRALEEVTSLNVNINTDKRQIMGSKTINISGSPNIDVNILGNVFPVSPQSFLQINSIEKLYNTALSKVDLQGKTVLDAYCGIGTITLSLAKTAKFVYGVEVIKSAIEDANKAKDANHIHNVSFHLDSCENFIPKLLSKGEKLDLITLDPPREGLHKKVVESIIKAQIPEILYISCDPHTLARDIKIFVESGYKVNSISPIDLFPHTPHVETVCLLTKTN